MWHMTSLNIIDSNMCTPFRKIDCSYDSSYIQTNLSQADVTVS